MVNWNRDEIILAADIVVDNGWTSPTEDDPKVQELSRLLISVGAQLHPGQTFPHNFRSPASVHRKMGDVYTADPNYGGARTKGGKTTAEVARDYREHPERMRAMARMIRAALASPEFHDETQLLVEVDFDHGVSEGRVVERFLRKRERDPKLRARKLSQVQRAGQPIACEVCGFDFAETYGPRGEGYIEVHHVVPLHVTGATTTRLADLVLLCANCHRMCHRSEWVTPGELRELMTHR